MKMKHFLSSVFHLFAAVFIFRTATCIPSSLKDHLLIHATRGQSFNMKCCWPHGDSLAFFDRVITDEEDQESAWAQDVNRLFQTGPVCSRLDIGHPSDRDKGIYHCRSFLQERPVKQFVVFLKYELDSVEQIQYLLLGRRTNQIAIRVTGSLPLVQWKKQDENTMQRNILVSYEDDMKTQNLDPKLKYQVSRSNGSLLINDVSLTDAGVYFVLLKSAQYGDKEVRINVKVEEQAEILKAQTKVLSVKGTTVTIQCSAVGIPKPRFKLFMSDQNIVPEKVRTRYLADGRTGIAEYSFNVGPKELTCTVTNDHGSDGTRIFLPKPEGSSKGSTDTRPETNNKDGGSYVTKHTTNTAQNNAPTSGTSTIKDFFNNKEAVKGLAIIGSAFIFLVGIVVLVVCKLRKRHLSNKMAAEDAEMGGDVTATTNKKYHKQENDQKHNNGDRDLNEKSAEKSQKKSSSKNGKFRGMVQTIRSIRKEPLRSQGISKESSPSQGEPSRSRGITKERSRTQRKPSESRGITKESSGTRREPSRSRGITKESSRPQRKPSESRGITKESLRTQRESSKSQGLTTEKSRVKREPSRTRSSNRIQGQSSSTSNRNQNLQRKSSSRK